MLLFSLLPAGKSMFLKLGTLLETAQVFASVMLIHVISYMCVILPCVAVGLWYSVMSPDSPILAVSKDDSSHGCQLFGGVY